MSKLDVHAERCSPVVSWLILASAMLFPSLMAWLYFVVLPGSQQGPSLVVRAGFATGKLLQFLLPVLCFWFIQRHPIRPLLPNTRGLRFGLIFGLLTGAGILVLYYAGLRGSSLLGEMPEKIRDKLKEFGLTTPAEYLLLSLFIAGFHSFLEEYYWRWFVFGWLERLLPVWPAIALSSLAFMAHHVIILNVYAPGHAVDAVVPFSLAIAVGGAVWAWLYYRAQSIYATWLSHLLVDSAIMLVGFNLAFP